MKIVNCESFVSLRSIPDGNHTAGRKTINLNDKVTFIRTAENGFYLVDYKGKSGYILAAYLAPVNSEIFKGSVSKPNFDRSFNQNDLTVNGIKVNSSGIQDIRNLYGDPVIIQETDRQIIWKYNDFSVSISKSTSKAVQIDIYNFNAYGPRQLCVGMNMAEALNTFPMNNSRILSGSVTHDLILYSSTNEMLDPPYAVIRNDGDGGNGVIKFYDPVKNACMDITIQNSRIKYISVYVK